MVEFKDSNSKRATKQSARIAATTLRATTAATEDDGEVGDADTEQTVTRRTVDGRMKEWQ